MARSSVVIVSPAVAGANNGNARTAQRWADLLGSDRPARVVREWPDAHADSDAVMLALHARRSAEAVRHWVRSCGPSGLAVVLTGTDLYRDVASDASAIESIRAAARLVVLQEMGIQALPDDLRAKARVIYQSTPSLPPARKSSAALHAIMVGHMRDVKSPQTLFEAARLLRSRPDIHIAHVGGEEEPGWAARARAVEADCPNYRWLGPLAHEATRERIRHAHVLVHTSAIEGGAHVIMEATTSGTPVLASHVAGNIGMLGAAYDGYFEHGSAAGLVDLLLRCRETQNPVDPAAGFLGRLRAQCAQRAPLFHPDAERAALLALIDELQNSP
jgi:putative glycosyltransferase (TIGR04348 family)